MIPKYYLILKKNLSMSEILNDIKEEIDSSKKTRIAINGFGRIGRMIFRAGFSDPNIEFVAINDLSSQEELAYLLKNDSAQGKFQYDIQIQGEHLIVGDKKVKIISEKDIHSLPWKENNIDIVAECTGRFTKVEDSKSSHRTRSKESLNICSKQRRLFLLSTWSKRP